MRCIATAVAIGLLAVPMSAVAQPKPKPAPPAKTVKPPKPVKPAKDRKWMIEVMGGGALATSPGDGGTAPTFAAGEPFTTEGGQPSRAVPSWFFGDGAVLFNQVSAQFVARGQQVPQITMLDPALGSAGMKRGTGATFGVRVARRLTQKIALEVAFQRAQGTMDLTDTVRNGLETSRASFESAFRGLFATMPQSGLQVSSAATLPSDVSGSQTTVTGALRFTISRGRRLETYAVAGAGRVSNSTDTAEARLRGSYQFRFLDTYAFAQDDNVTIRYAQKESAIVGVVGGGMTFDLGPGHGIRLDVRVHAGDGGSTTSIQASPTAATNNPPLALPSITTPSIQFSNSPAAKSSLSARLTETEIFKGSGLEARGLATVGFYFRF